MALRVGALHDDGARAAHIGQHLAGGHFGDDDVAILKVALQIAERVDGADVAARAAAAHAFAAQEHVADDVRLDEVGRAGNAGRHARGDDDHVAGLDQPALLRRFDGGVDELVRVAAHAHVRGHNAVAQAELVVCVLARGRGDDRAIRAEAGDHARRRAGVARGDDRVRVEVARHLAAGIGYGVGHRANRRVADGFLLEKLGIVVQLMRLDIGRDAHHRADGLNRVFARGRLAGEHDRVRAVDDGVRHVAGLRAGRARVADHGIEHLRRGDDRFGRHVALVDELLLEHRHLFHIDFHAQIAARDHDAVGNLEDFVEVVHAHAVFDLGEDLHMAAAVVGAELAEGQHVAGAADEGRGDQVDALLNAEDDVAAILLADGGHLQIDVRHGNALAAAEHAAVDHAAHDVRAARDLLDVQRDQAVVDQDSVAGVHQLNHPRIGDGDLRFVALDVAAGQDELLPRLQGHLVSLERLGAHLRSLGIQHDGDRDVLLPAQALDAVDARALLLVGAVGHIQAAYVHARVHQLGDHLLAVAGRAERTHDFRLSDHLVFPP